MVIGTPTVLNLIPGGVMKVIHVNQVNENIEIQFRIMNGAQPFNVPEGVSCTIRGTKGDNFGYAADVAVTAGSNIVTVTLTEQLTAVAGAGNIFELVFVGASDDMKVSTENFLLDVERAALGEDTVISDSDLAYADQVLDQLQSVGAVNAQVQQNKANIAAEITRATAAEQTLQQNINAEAAARQAADNTLQSNINAEASSRATTDASLQSQINQLVAPSGEAPSAAEVENARIGSDGTVYPTLGDAIRTQNSLLKSQIGLSYTALENEFTSLASGTAESTETATPTLTAGTAIDYSTGALVTSGLLNSYASTDFIPIPNASKIVHTFYGYGNYGCAFYALDKSYISGNKNVMTITDIPQNAMYVRFTDYVAAGTHPSKTVTITNTFPATSGVKNIVDASIADLEMVTPSILSNNLIDPNAIEKNGYYLYNTGAWVANTSISSSGLIPCTSGDKFTIGTLEGTVGTQVTYWQKDGTTYVSGADLSAGTVITVPSNNDISYLRVSLRNNGRTFYRLNRGTVDLGYDKYQYGYGYTCDLEAPNIRSIEKKTSILGNKFAHFSFDDCTFWDDITQNASTYTSAFDNPFLSDLKTLHQNYGIKFTLFCFIQNGTASIANVTNKFASEFSANKDWLRFGFHGTTDSETFTNADPATVLGYYNTFVNGIYQMTGDYECIDRVVRTSSFSGSANVCKTLRDANCGLSGFLCNDNNAGSYYLSSDQNTYINARCKLFDNDIQLTFIKSLTRLESTAMTVSVLNGIEYQNRLPLYEFFTHQTLWTAGLNQKLGQFAAWLNEHDFVYDYAQYIFKL